MNARQEHPSEAMKVLCSTLQQYREIGDKSVASDFVFLTNLPEDPGGMLITSARTPVLDGPEICSIQVAETVLGLGRKLVRAMHHAGEFEATMFEDGTQTIHSVARKIRCKYISSSAAPRDWTRRGEIACYEVQLEMTVLSEKDGSLRKFQPVDEGVTT